MKAEGGQGGVGQRYGWVLESHHFRDVTIHQMQPGVLTHE